MVLKNNGKSVKETCGQSAFKAKYAYSATKTYYEYAT